MSVFLNLLWFFRQEWRRYSVAVFALVVIAMITMIPPWIVGRIVDAIATDTLSRSFLYQQVGIVLVIAVVTYVLRVVWRVALFGASYTLANQLRQKLFTHLCLQSPRFFQRMKTGDLMARATNDIQAVEMTAGEAVLALFDGALTGTIVLVLMTVFISWPLTLVALIPWPIVGYAMWRFGKALHESFNDAQARFSDLNNDVQESLSAVRLTRALGRENAEKAQFNRVAAAANEANQRVARIDARYDPAISLGVGFSFLFSVAGGAWLIHTGDMTLGQLTTFTMYLGYMIWPMFAIGWLLNLVERGKAAYERIEAIFAMAPDIDDNGHIDRPLLPSLDVAIRAFRYEPEGKPVLEDVVFEVAPGELIGIVGHTGAGKSTLLNLLARLDEGPACSIKLGGEPISHLTMTNLRRHVAMVPQSPFLFSATIAENIALARPEASRQEIETVARIAQIHEDIQRFPDQYQTMVGERGITLSGGQKQRIAIARALLQDAPVLLLDDALSAVDVRTEQSILRHLREARAGRTTLVVCHRLTAVETAQQILVLGQGRIVERGDHHNLLARRGWYRQMYDYQQLEQAVEEGR